MVKTEIILFLLIINSTLSSQTFIWGGPGDPNSEFAGGLNDWTTNGVSPNENALWFWNEDGLAEDGAYSIDQSITSASLENGAASFDSDYLDNDGIQGNFGNGLSAAPQIGELISPEFSTLGHDLVTITWTQYVRQYASQFYVEVTSDGGETWTSFPIEYNNNLPQHEASKTDDVVFIDVSSKLGNKETVQFKFVYEANYYFWTIDDVYVIDAPKVELEVISIRHPFNAVKIPNTLIRADSLEFGIEFKNNGKQNLSDALATVKIVKENGSIKHSVSQHTGPVDSFSTKSLNFDEVILPPDIYLDDGYYTVEYDIQPLQEMDANPNNNMVTSEIEITESQYAAHNGETDSLFFNPGPYYPTLILKTGYIHYHAQKIFIKAASENQDSISNAHLQLTVMKVIDQSSESADFLTASTAYGDIHPNLEVIGYGHTFIEKVENYEEIGVDILESNSNHSILILDPYETYLFSFAWETTDSTFIRTAISTDVTYGEPTNNVYIPNDTTGWYSVDPSLAWAITLEIIPIYINTEEISTLDEQLILIHPNPSSGFTILNFDYEVATDVTICLLNSKGETISTMTQVGITNEEVEFDVSDLSSGVYYFEFKTKQHNRMVKQFIKIE